MVDLKVRLPSDRGPLVSTCTERPKETDRRTPQG